MGAVNGMHPDGTVDTSSEQSKEVWVGTTYALAAFMLGRGLTTQGWETARGAAAVTYEPRTLVPNPRGVRSGRQLPGQPVPATARDLGDRGGARATRGMLGP